MSDDPERLAYKSAFNYLIDYVVTLPYDDIHVDVNTSTMWTGFDMHIGEWFVSIARAIDAEYNEVWVHISLNTDDFEKKKDGMVVGEISFLEAQKHVNGIVERYRELGAGTSFEHDIKNETDAMFAGIRNEYQEKDYGTV